jgi:hypothetical protein
MQLMPNPGGVRAMKATFDRDEDLASIIEILRPLMQRHIIGNGPNLRSALGDMFTHKTKADFLQDERGIIGPDGPKKYYDEFNSSKCMFLYLSGVCDLTLLMPYTVLYQAHGTST